MNFPFFLGFNLRGFPYLSCEFPSFPSNPQRLSDLLQGRTLCYGSICAMQRRWRSGRNSLRRSLVDGFSRDGLVFKAFETRAPVVFRGYELYSLYRFDKLLLCAKRGEKAAEYVHIYNIVIIMIMIIMIMLIIMIHYYYHYYYHHYYYYCHYYYYYCYYIYLHSLEALMVDHLAIHTKWT